MSCKALARGSFDSPTVQAVAANGQIQFANTESTCEDVNFNGDDVVIRRPGTYLVEINATTVATAAGAEEIQLLRNGTAVPGAHAVETAAAVGNFTSMSFATLISVPRCGTASLAVRSIPATSVRVANIVIAEQEV